LSANNATTVTRKEWLLEVCGLNEETYRFATDPQLLVRILSDLEQRIKHDRAVKLSVFFTGLSAFLHEPINLFQKGESGIGKSYNTVQTLKYFPAESLMLLGGLSPKALIHDCGILLTEDGKPADMLEPPEKPRKTDYASSEEYEEAKRLYKKQLKEYANEMKKTYTLIELAGKTLVFLEAPEYEAFRMLYPILSHDTERIEYRFVDKLAKGQLKTMRVVIQGWPATVFLTTDRKYMEELATRSFTVTPENSSAKIEAANQLTNLKASYPWLDGESEEARKIRAVLNAVRMWFAVAKADVVVPFEGLQEFFPCSIVRDMRDFQHFIQFLKTVTALHLFQRPVITIGDRRFVVSSLGDVAFAVSVYTEVFETTRTGTERAVLDFYHNVVKQRDSWYLKDLTEEYNLQASKKLSSESIRVRLDRLAQIGYVDVEKDADNKRNVYKPLVREDDVSKNPLKTLSWQELSLKLREGFKKWKSHLQKIQNLHLEKFFSALTAEAPQSYTLDDLEADVLDEKFFSILPLRLFGDGLKAEKSVEQENKPLKSQKDDSCQFLDMKPSEPRADANEPPKASALSEPEEKSAPVAREKTVVLHRLPPVEHHRCDGVDAGGANCTFEAQYRLTEENGAQYYFCGEHVKKVAKSYTENGYKVILKEIGKI